MQTLRHAPVICLLIKFPQVAIHEHRHLKTGQFSSVTCILVWICGGSFWTILSIQMRLLNSALAVVSLVPRWNIIIPLYDVLCKIRLVFMLEGLRPVAERLWFNMIKFEKGRLSSTWSPDMLTLNLLPRLSSDGSKCGTQNLSYLIVSHVSFKSHHEQIHFICNFLCG